MSITIKSKREIELMKEAGKIVADAHKLVSKNIKPGISTLELDKLVEEYIISKGAIPSFKGYGGFPGSICASVNEVVVHGIPNNNKLISGDIISVDIGAYYKGYHGDSAWTYPVGKISEEDKKLLEDTKNALFAGLEKIKAGARLGDISNAIEIYATENNLGIVEELAGHGVGSELHEDPMIPNYGKKGRGVILKEGMTLAIEPMLNLGTKKVIMSNDGWTISTADNKKSAHFEHTILVKKDSYEILTKS